jgi:hypothetical protein
VSKNTAIALVVAIILMPMLYFLLPGDELDTAYSFRGIAVRTLSVNEGMTTMPTSEQDALGAPLQASVKAPFLEKLGGVKAPNSAGLVFEVTPINDNLSDCAEKGKTTAFANFELSVRCSEKEFATMKLENKTQLQVDHEQQMLVYGNSGANAVRVFHKNLMISYTSPDMTQSERKREACLARAAVSHLMNEEVSTCEG